MPKIREILGHVSIQTAARKRKCTRKPDKHAIAKGESCLVIKGGTYNAEQSYCGECASAILDKAEQDLSHLRSLLIGTAQ